MFKLAKSSLDIAAGNSYFPCTIMFHWHVSTCSFSFFFINKYTLYNELVYIVVQIYLAKLYNLNLSAYDALESPLAD